MNKWNSNKSKGMKLKFNEIMVMDYGMGGGKVTINNYI